MTTTEEQQDTFAGRMGFTTGTVVQELGHDDDVDENLRTGIEKVTGNKLVDEDYNDVPGAVVLWFRDEDGDLAETLLNVSQSLDEDGVLWLLVPKPGKNGHVEPGTVAEAAQTAGLTRSTSPSVAASWAGTKLVAPKSRKP